MRHEKKHSNVIRWKTNCCFGNFYTKLNNFFPRRLDVDFFLKKEETNGEKFLSKGRKAK